MKKIYNIINLVSGILFLILWVVSKFDFSPNFNTDELRVFFMLLFYYTGYNYFKMIIKDKNKKIKKLKRELKKKNL